MTSIYEASNQLIVRALSDININKLSSTLRSLSDVYTSRERRERAKQSIDLVVNRIHQLDSGVDQLVFDFREELEACVISYDINSARDLFDAHGQAANIVLNILAGAALGDSDLLLAAIARNLYTLTVQRDADFCVRVAAWLSALANRRPLEIGQVACQCVAMSLLQHTCVRIGHQVCASRVIVGALRPWDTVSAHMREASTRIGFSEIIAQMTRFESATLSVTTSCLAEARRSELGVISHFERMTKGDDHGTSGEQ